MDFGTGRELTDRATSDLAGTPLYVAPEVLDGESGDGPERRVQPRRPAVPSRSPGRTRYRGSRCGEIRAAHAARSTSRVRVLRPDVPIRIERAIERALEHDPSKRYASAAAFAGELSAAPGRKRHGRFLYSGIAAAAVLLVDGGALGTPVECSSGNATDDRSAGIQEHERRT